MEFSVFDTASYTVEHLFDSEENESLISRFTVPNNAMGLESYLKNAAMVMSGRVLRDIPCEGQADWEACMLFHAQGRPDYHAGGRGIV